MGILDFDRACHVLKTVSELRLVARSEKESNMPHKIVMTRDFLESIRSSFHKRDSMSTLAGLVVSCTQMIDPALHAIILNKQGHPIAVIKKETRHADRNRNAKRDQDTGGNIIKRTVTGYRPD